MFLLSMHCKKQAEKQPALLSFHSLFVIGTYLKSFQIIFKSLVSFIY